MTKRQRADLLAKLKLRNRLAEIDDAMLLADGFEDAIIGVTGVCGNRPACVVYVRRKCIEILKERDGMTHEDAEEYFAFNVACAWVGDHTPLFLETVEDLTPLFNWFDWKPA